MLRIAEGYQNLCKLQRCRQHVEKSISNEIVLQWSSQESSGWKNPKDSVSFCQSIKDNVLLWCYKIIPTGQRKLKYKRAVRRCGCTSSWILRPRPRVGIWAGTHSSHEATYGSSAFVCYALMSAHAKCSLSLFLIPSNPHIYPSSYLIRASWETPAEHFPWKPSTPWCLSRALKGTERGFMSALDFI